jgi:hypothetical protein
VLSILRLLSGQHLCFFLFDQHRVLARDDRLPLDSRLGRNPVSEVKPSLMAFLLVLSIGADDWQPASPQNKQKRCAPKVSLSTP